MHHCKFKFALNLIQLTTICNTKFQRFHRYEKFDQITILTQLFTSVPNASKTSTDRVNRTCTNLLYRKGMGKLVNLRIKNKSGMMLFNL